MQKDRLDSPLGFFIVASLLAITWCCFFVSHLDYIPAWDAGWYYACIFNAVEAPFKLSHLNCVGHVSAAYIGILALFQRIEAGNPVWLYIANACLLALAAIFFYLIAKSFDSHEQEQRRFDLSDVLISGCFLLCPAIIANLFHINLDFGVMIFSLGALYALRSDRPSMVAVFGTLMIFSKEIAIPLFMGMLIVGVVLFPPRVLRYPGKKGKIIRLVLLGLPLFIYAARTVRRMVLYPDQSLFYTEEEYQFAEKPLLSMALDFDIFEPTFMSYLVDIFVFQFNWLFTGIALFCLLLCFKGKGVVATLRNPTVLSMALLLLGALYLVTRHRPFNHIRYVLPVIPLLFLFSYALMKTSLTRVKLRIILSLVCVLFSLSQLHSFDPLSKLYFGTIALGERSMFNMARFFFHGSDQQPYFNRDELAYNLQFMYPLRAAELAFREIRPDGHTTMLGSKGSKFYWPGFLEEESFKRIGRRSDKVFRAHYFDSKAEFSNVHVKPDRLAFIEFPQFFSAHDLTELQEWYSIASSQEINVAGYHIQLYWMDKIR